MRNNRRRFVKNLRLFSNYFFKLGGKRKVLD